MAFIATSTEGHGRPETLGVVRAVADANYTQAEFAIIVRSDLKGQGLGRLLMDKMIHYYRSQGIQRLIGQTLPQNKAMMELAERTGFMHKTQSDNVVELTLDLKEG